MLYIIIHQDLHVNILINIIYKGYYDTIYHNIHYYTHSINYIHLYNSVIVIIQCLVITQL